MPRKFSHGKFFFHSKVRKLIFFFLREGLCISTFPFKGILGKKNCVNSGRDVMV